MLSQSFFDWWFAPWNYAAYLPDSMLQAKDQLGLRDGYRLWCKQVQINADLPMQFDPSWNIAICTSADQLLLTAQLFAGLIAARENDTAALQTLPFADRKWCMRTAATQPLRRCCPISYTVDEAIEIRGLVELAVHLEPRCAGMWSRLRLMLEPALVDRIDPLMLATLAQAPDIEDSAARAQRCWRMCRNRVDVTMNGSD
jgi:hypothetical protein